ncbi:putative membrane protein YccC [Arthrobacter sp. PL16]|uniref:FUSC family protein n=1 Tax=Arthrobacter sp. PL16 TaxID=3071720 RepID=UPI002E0C6FD5|nr:putative membrane protein YccC [Arthrobacter sp. PL16]
MVGGISPPDASGAVDPSDREPQSVTLLRDLVSMAPSARDHHPALRCAVGVGIPLLAVLLLGRLDLAVFATFGAFAGIYGRNEPHRRRLATQLRGGGLMLAVVLVAALTARADVGPWGLVLLASVVAGLGTFLAGLFRLRPGGSLFHIFAFAAIASVPAQPPLWQGITTAAATVVIAVVLGQAGNLWPRYRTAWLRHTPADRITSRHIASLARESGLYLAAALLAGSLATLLGIGHTYWAMVAATVPLVGQSARARVTRGLQRILGTFAGLVLTALILLPDLEAWQLVLVIAVAQFAAEMFILRQYALAQAFVTPLALVATELAHPTDATVLLADRAVETLIGAFVGIALVLALHLRQRASREPV